MTTTGKEWLTVKEFHQEHPYLKLNFLYELAATKRLCSFKVGGKVLIASDALEQLAEDQKRIANVVAAVD